MTKKSVKDWAILGATYALMTGLLIYLLYLFL